MTLSVPVIDGDGWLTVGAATGGASESFRADDGFRVLGFGSGPGVKGDVVVLIEGIDSERDPEDTAGAVALDLSVAELADLIDQLSAIWVAALRVAPAPGLGAAGAPVPHIPV